MKELLLDIRIMDPNAPSCVDKSIDQVYIAHEKEKKRAYNERVIQMEKDTFTPIVMSTSGGVRKEIDRHHKRRRDSYADVLNYIRTRLRLFIEERFNCN